MAYATLRNFNADFASRGAGRITLRDVEPGEERKALIGERGNLEVEVLGPWLAAPAAGERGACSSYMVHGGARVLLDCGPGAAALLQERDLTRSLDAIVISHMDSDHVLGLVPLANLLRTSAMLSGFGTPRKLPLYVPQEDGREVLASLERIWNPEAREEAAPFSDVFDLVEYGEEDDMSLDGMDIRFRRTRHHRPCFSPRVSDGRSVFVYSADTGYAPEMVDHAKDADLFLCEATLLEEHPRWAEEHGHLTGERAGKLAARAGARRLVLTHLGPDSKTNAENRRRAEAVFGGEVELAKSGEVYRI